MYDIELNSLCADAQETRDRRAQDKELLTLARRSHADLYATGAEFGPRVRLYGPDDPVFIDGKNAGTLWEHERNVIGVLMHGSFDLKTLREKLGFSKKSSPHKTLAALARRSPLWRRVLTFPGRDRRGGGYGIAKW